MIIQKDKLFILNTDNTTYSFMVDDAGYPEHLYYGPLIENFDEEDARAVYQKKLTEVGNGIVADPDFPLIMPEDMSLEISGRGKGDIREPMLELVFPDGSRSVDFRYKNVLITELRGTSEPDGFTEPGFLPGAYDASGRAERLIVILEEKSKPVSLELIYDVYEKCDVIVRSCRLRNTGDESFTVERLLSMQIDFTRSDLILRSFHGAWTREMSAVDTPVRGGAHVISSAAGTSSNRSNPFCMLYEEGATETSGLCYGFNLIYSGNHYEVAEMSPHGKTRFASGINPLGFSWRLGAGESFTAPQAVMTVSNGGFSGMSISMQHFVREHIVRGEWKYKERPVLVNSWEAMYFGIDERKLIKLAQSAKSVGIEMLVMDDGWFGARNDDHSSLGDWYVNKKKLPGGVKGICDKINALGLDFGIWVEPEMVNVDSDLYRAHPEWVMEVPGRDHSEGRYQRILDMSNPDVVEHLTEELSSLFGSANIAYVKWDMNRIFSDVYSKDLPADRQGEVSHRYILGLYRLMKNLTDRFPEILFEGCASGGNRFDLGILSLFPQIWASDNTDAISRAGIQSSYSYGYPLSVMSNHVSACPNHQTLRSTPLGTRFNIAALGVLGYELNLSEMSRSELDAIKDQVETYKKWRTLLQFGDIYRGGFGVNKASFAASEIQSFTVVSEDMNRAVGVILQKLYTANTQTHIYMARGLDPKNRYRFYNVPATENILQFGSLINSQLPVHIKQDSFGHKMIAKYKTLPGDAEDYLISGSTLMNAGVKLSPAFAGTGYTDGVRIFLDFASRMYFMEAEENEAE